jgi:hypothetical protein
MYGGLGWPTTDLTADLSARGLRLLLPTVLAPAAKYFRSTAIRDAALARGAA